MRKVLLAVFLPAVLFSGTLYWAPVREAGTGGPLGGDGMWDKTTANWWDGQSAANTVWTDGSSAVFSGTAGTLHLGVALGVVNTADFQVVGYKIDLAPATGSPSGAYSMTVNWLAGQSATITNSSTGGSYAGLTIQTASNQTNEWNGNIIGGRLQAQKQGSGVFISKGVINVWQDFYVRGGRLVLSGKTGSTFNGGYLTVEGGPVLDVGGNDVIAGTINLLTSNGGIITSSETGRLTHYSPFFAGSMYGRLEGSLQIGFADNGGNGTVHVISGASNKHTGGLIFYFIPGGRYAANDFGTSCCDVRAQANGALGTGSVVFAADKNPAFPARVNTNRLTFLCPRPVIGGLCGSGTAGKEVVLGASGSSQVTLSWDANGNAVQVKSSPWGAKTVGLAAGQKITAAGLPDGTVVTEMSSSTWAGINTRPAAAGNTVAAEVAPLDTMLTLGSVGTNETFAGVIRQAAGTVGSIVKTGSGKWTVNGLCLYTGGTTLENGSLDGTGLFTTDLATNTPAFTVKSGQLDVSQMTLNLVGTIPATRSLRKILVDYSAGGSVVESSGGSSFSAITSTENLRGCTVVNDTTARLIYFQTPGPATLIKLY